MKNRKFKPMALVLFLFIGFITLFAGNVTFFGPKQYTRDKGKPVTETDTFTCPTGYTGSGFTLRLINGDSQGNHRVSSAVIKVNGIEVMGPPDFNQNVGLIERTIDLVANNEISVKLNSKPDSFVIIDIYKFIPEPEVTFIANPDTIQYQQFSTLSWNVVYADSISIDNGIGNVGPSGSVQVSPEVPTTTYTLTAVNLGGITTKQVTVTVIFPVPTVTFSASPLIIQPGAVSTLTWTTFAAHTVSIDQGIGNVELNGSLGLSPADTTTYTLTAVGYGGTQTAEAIITVDGIPPQVNVTEPADGSYLNSTNVVVKGQVIDSSPVTLKINNSDVPLQPENFFEVSLQLVEGPNMISFDSQDAAGNQTFTQVNLVIDITAPQVQITAPQNNAVIREIPITITGTFTEINPLRILLNNTIEGMISGDGFTFENVNLVEGENQLLVILEDKAGNSGSASITVNYIPDAEPPEIIIVSPQDGTFRSKPEVTVSGTVIDQSDLAYVRVNGNDAQLQDENFSFTLTLAEGENTIVVEAADVYENKGSKSVNVTLDTILPLITITQPLAGAYLNTTEVVVKGTVEDTSPVTLKINGLNVPMQGNAFETTLALVQGANLIKVEAQDAAGNASSQELEVFADSIAPVIEITSPQANTITNRDKITVTGAIIDENPYIISYGATEGEIIGNHFYFRDIDLQEGENTFEFLAEDRAGNTAQHSLTVVRDSVVPQLTVLQPISGALLAQRSTLVKGTVFDEHLKDVRVNNFACPVENNEFNMAVNLVEGQNTLTITASDTAGNFVSKTLVITVDTVVPLINITFPQANARLNTPSITVSGRADDIHLASVKINGQPAVLSNNEFTLSGVMLQEGSNTIAVEAQDAAGHTNNQSILVTLDTAVPSVQGVVPADQTMRVPLSSDIRVEFSEPVDESTLTGDTVYLESDGQKLNSTITQEGTIVVLEPLGMLPDGAQVFVYVSAGLKDLAGNGLQVPYTGSFFTRDITPPNAPQLNMLPEKTALAKITISGTAENNAGITVSGGLNLAQGQSDDQGNFSIEVLLKQDRLNQLCVTAADASGNESIPACLSIYQESAEFVVKDAEFENNIVKVIFSKPLDISTLTFAQFKVSSASGVESGTLTAGANNTEARFTPDSDLSTQMIMVEVKTGIKDVEGIPLNYPFTKVFNQQGGEIIAQGEVYDDQTGLPLGGALVQLISVDGSAPAEPAPSTITTSEGKYVLVLPAGQCTIRISKENYTYSDRVVLFVSGFSSSVFDSRITPINPDEKTLLPEGGVISAKSGLLAYPPGAVDVEKTARLTVVGPQSLQGRLPSGWSPLAGFDLQIQEGELLTSCHLRAANQWPGIVSSSLVLAWWDDTAYQWQAVSGVSVSTENISGSINRKGHYAFLIKDIAPVVPPQPVMGQPLVGVTPGAIPTGITAKLDFTPSAIYPGETSSAVMTITSTSAVSSGVPVQAKISENYELITGSTATFVPYTADLTAYNYGTGTVKVEFNLSPNSQITLSELKIGTIKSDMVRYSAVALGMVLGPEGGTVIGDGGAEITIEPGAVTKPIAVTINKTDPAELTTSLPAGFELIGAIDLSLGGAQLLTPAVISLSLTQDELNNIPPDAQLFTVRLEKPDYQLSWVLKSQGIIEDTRIKSFIDTAAGLPFPGVTRGGTYLFLRALSPTGIITGTVVQDTQPFTGALVSVDNHDIQAVSAGNYVQIGFVGAVALTAKNLTTRDEGTGSGTIQNTGDIINLTLNILKTGPEIVSITPEDNAVSVHLNSKITFIFSEPINAATFNDQTVYINKGTERVAGIFQLSSDGKQGEFIPHQDFPSDSEIDITVTTGLQDLFANAMAQVFTAGFRTLDVVPPGADLSKITVYMPENGSSSIVGEAGSVEPGAVVIVFNERTGQAVTVTGLSDGSFSTAINAEITDKITVKVVDTAGNENVLDSKPFVSADGKRVVLGSQAAEFISSEGLGIIIQEGTFSEPVNIGMYEVTDPQVLAPLPQGFERFKAMTLDFDGNRANKPVDISIPAPPGVTDSSNIFVAREVEVFGQKRLMIIDATVIKNGRIYSACEPFEDYFRAFDGTISILRMLFDSVAFVSGIISNPGAVIFLSDLCYIPQNCYYVFPVPVNLDVQIIVKDLATGEKLYEKTTPGPTVMGQVYNFEEITDDRDKYPPMIIKSLGILTFGFDVTAQTIKNQGIIIIPHSDDTGKIDSIKIEGEAGTAAVLRDDDPAGTPNPSIRVYKLQKKQDSDRYEYVEIDQFEAFVDGSFSQEGISVQQGDQVIVAVEKGGVNLNQEFILSFSEPLDTAYKDGNVPITIYEIEGTSETQVKVRTQLLETGTELSIIPENQLKENQVYLLKTFDSNDNYLSDRNGNRLSIQCNFRAKRSYSLYSETGANEVYDTLLMGNIMFVAGGFQGLRILDVSNPLDVKTITTYTNFAGKIRGLAQYRENEDSPVKLVVSGGGSACPGFIKILNISDLKNPFQEKSQIISDNYTGSVSLPEGSPRHVRVLGNYAFINAYGAGLAVVDIPKMTAASNKNCLIRYHYEDYINDMAVYKRMTKDPNNPEQEVEQYVAVILVDYYGIKLLDLNRSADEDPNTTDPYAKYYMLEIGDYKVPERKHLMGLVLAANYWVDIDRDGRQGAEEDKDQEQDNDIMGRNITKEDETRDMVFFSVPSLQKIVILDITEPTAGMTPYGEFIVEDGLGNYAERIGEMELSKQDRVLYVADLNMGLVIIDANLSGENLGAEAREKMFLGNINTSGQSRFGITIDEELNMAYVGQIEKGVEIIKLQNPEIKFVYKKDGKYLEVTKISPSGIKDSDNPREYPDEIYVMALLPGGIAQAGTDDAKKAICELWALNRFEAPVAAWDNDKVKTYLKELELYRQSDDPRDQWYKVFLSKPIRITIDPDETRVINYTDRSGSPQTSDLKILSGDLMWVHLSEDFITQYNQQDYISAAESPRVGDMKPSIRADFIDREENFDFEGVSAGSEEKPNSPINNPSMYANVYLHSGEYLQDETDMRIAGRGFDFVFTRTYRSQGIYSGVLGWGWDHNYNKRLLELYNGDIIYYDGTGRRERFKVKDGQVGKYTSPRGWFTELLKIEDGTFVHKYSDATIEKFDASGRLIKIQDRNQNKMEFFYDVAGQLSAVMDTMGRLIQFEYEPFDTEGIGADTKVKPKSNRLIEIRDFSGRTLQFDYYDNGDLKSVDFAGRVKEYIYTSHDDIKLAHNLEKINDPSGAASGGPPVLKITYDNEDKVDMQRFIETDADIDFTIGETITTVADARGKSKTFTNPDGTHREVTNGGYTFIYDFNDDGLITLITFPEGNTINYIYNSSNKSRRSQGNLLSVTSSGSDGTITYSYQYENYFNQLEKIIDGKNNETLVTLDGNGNIDKVTPPETPAYDYDFNEYGQLEKVTDPMGSITEYTYYPESTPTGDGSASYGGRVLDGSTGGYLQSVTVDKGGDNISQIFTYDKVGNISFRINGEGVKTIYQYDNPFGQVTTLIGGATGSEDGQPAVNLTTTFDYDDNGNVTKRISRGVTTEYEYDRLNRLSVIRYKGGSDAEEIVQEYKYKYDNNSNLLEITNPKGSKDTFDYDDRDLLKNKTLGNGLTAINYTYTPNGNLYIMYDGENKPYKHVYDSHGRLKEILDPLMNIVRYEFDANSNVTSEAEIGNDGAAFNQSFDYDKLNQVTHHKIQKQDGHIITQYGYNHTGNLTSVTTPTQHIWGITPTGSGLTKIITDPLGNRNENHYDQRGWLTNVNEIEAGGRSLSQDFTNTVLGDLTLTKDSIGRNYNYLYNPKNQELGIVKDPEGGEVSYTYDGLNRLKKEIHHITYKGETKNAETIYEYDANDNLERIIDAHGNITRYIYDDKNRLTHIFYPDNLYESFTYNGNDQIRTYTDMNGTSVINTYDDAGRLTDRSISPAPGVAGSTYEHFEYDGLNRLTKASNNDSEVVFIYDRAGRLETEIQNVKEELGGGDIIVATYEVKYEYDDNGNKTKIIYPSGKKVQVTPDQLDRINTIHQINRNNNKLLASYTYEGRGKVVHKNLQDTIHMNSTFDDGRRPTELTYKNNANKVFFFKNMAWNKVDLKKYDRESGKGENYDYDSAYRLRKVTDTKKNTQTEYSIDEVDNIDESKKTREGVTESIGAVYNERNQLIKYNDMDLSYDNNGNLKHYYSEYVYNWKNQLVEVISGTGVNVEYKYDVLGRRIEKTVKDPSSEDITRYIYDGFQVIEERDKDGELITRYTYGNGIDELIEIEKDEDNDGNLESYLPMQNNINSVIGIADSNGKLIERVEYTDFGSPAFIYDKEAPRVDNIRIEAGDIFIRFSESIDKDTAENAIKIKRGVNEVPGTFTFDEENKRVIFSPSGALPQNETLSIVITTDLKDIFENKLAEEFLQDFICTGADMVIYDRVPPEIETVKLISGEFIVEFTEELHPDSIANSIGLTSCQGNFTGSVTQEDAKTLKFDSDQNLSISIEYTLEIRTVLTDLSGKNLNSSFSGKFIYQGKDIIIYEKPNPAEHKVSIFSNTCLFHGRNYESETGLYYYRHRYYHPELGRFLQIDPMGYEDSMNLYQAFWMNPINITDPMGLYGIDFHYYVIYYLMRAKGWSHEKSNEIAAWSEYVDVSIVTNPVHVNTIVSAIVEVINTTGIPLGNPLEYFHFHGSDIFTPTVSNDPDARRLVIEAVDNFMHENNKFSSFLRLGVALHIYADTWAHEGYQVPIGHALKLSKPDAIRLNKDNSSKAFDAVMHIWELIPENPNAEDEDKLSWDEFEKIIKIAFAPFEGHYELSATNSAKMVINSLRSLLKRKYGISKLNVYKFKKREKFYRENLEKYFGLFWDWR